ncbi:MAG: hypothetical protein KAS32_06180 [Candidatus Peribacteraceae bacterium]|nr:hypothetical protein [Candidatus Peribacteraceae bacterium]
MDKNAIVIIGLVTVLGIMVVCSGNDMSLVEELNDSGWVMYGASWCGACNVQKEMLGEGVNKLNYVDCEMDGMLCVENSIEYLPTWINDMSGERVVGIIEIGELKNMCK